MNADRLPQIVVWTLIGLTGLACIIGEILEAFLVILCAVLVYPWLSHDQLFRQGKNGPEQLVWYPMLMAPGGKLRVVWLRWMETEKVRQC